MGGSIGKMNNAIVIVDIKKKTYWPEGSLNGEQRVGKP